MEEGVRIVDNETTPTIPPSKFSVERWREGLAAKPKQDPYGVKVDHHTRLMGPLEWSLPFLWPGDSYVGSVHFSGDVEPEFVRFDQEEDGCAIYRLRPDTIISIQSLKIDRGYRGLMYLQVLEIKEMKLEHIDTMLENLLQGPAPRLMQSLTRLVRLPKHKQKEQSEPSPDPNPPDALPEGRDS